MIASTAMGFDNRFRILTLFSQTHIDFSRCLPGGALPRFAASLPNTGACLPSCLSTQLAMDSCVRFMF